MRDQERLMAVEKKIIAGAVTREDAEYLLSVIRDQDKKLKILSQQVLELNQEIENVKSDFGESPR